MLRSWIVQLCIVVFLWIVLTMFKNRFKNIWPRRLKKLDVLCIFLIIAIHFTSIELIGISLFPYLVLVMSVVGLIMIFASAYRSGDIVYGVFWTRFIRILDLVTLFTYFIVLIMTILRLFYCSDIERLEEIPVAFLLANKIIRMNLNKSITEIYLKFF